MALVNVEWTEHRRYATQVEIEDFDPAETPPAQVRQAIREAIADLDDLHDYEREVVDPIEITAVHIVSQGDES